jgi:hypothetical protein
MMGMRKPKDGIRLEQVDVKPQSRSQWQTFRSWPFRISQRTDAQLVVNIVGVVENSI